MPIYDLFCDVCDNELPDTYVKTFDDLPMCCGQVMKKRVSSRVQAGFPKYGLTLDNVADHPIHFETKNQLKAFKRKHDLELGALPND